MNSITVHDSVVRCTSPASSISADELTAGHDHSLQTNYAVGVSLDDSRNEEAMQAALRDPSVFWVRVSGLDEHITNSSLCQMFYHHGSNDAFVLPCDSRTKQKSKSGIVSFSYAEMASLAVAKVNGFVPFGQSQPLQVDLVDAVTIIRDTTRAPLPANVSECSPGNDERNPTQTLAILVQDPSSAPWAVASHLAGLMAVDVVSGCCTVVAVAKQLSTVDRIKLATALLCYFTHFDSGSAVSAAVMHHLQCDAECHGLLQLVQSGVSNAAVSRASQRSVPRDVSLTTRRRQEEAVSRTIYISRIPMSMSPRELMSFLSSFGFVTKVRLCQTSNQKGGTCQFAFVEMQHSASAQFLCFEPVRIAFGYHLRIQPARSPIQDSDVTDACIGPAGVLLRPCSFGAQML